MEERIIHKCECKKYGKCLIHIINNKQYCSNCGGAWDEDKYLRELEEKKFIKKNPGLVREWEKYKKTQIKNGLDLSESFFNWLHYIKVKDEMKGGNNNNGI